MWRSVLAIVFILCLSICASVQPMAAQGLRLKLSESTNGFHIPRQWHGRTIFVTRPENEHVAFSIEDMFAAANLKLDVLVGQTKGINNAFAVIDGVGDQARRLVVIDPEWSYRFPHYRVILAHELGHHICRHTLDRYNAANRWEMELEADRAGGALLRASYADGQGSVGGDIINLSNIVETIRLLGPGSETHPPSELRVRAFTEGWNSGSPCLHTAYVPINPFPKIDPTVVERIALRYGNQTEWCFFGGELVTLGTCQARHPRVRVQVDGNRLKISLMKPNSVNVRGVFPPDYRGIAIGSILFEGASDKEKITGTFWHRVPGCGAVSYDGEGKFTENNGLFLTGEIPKMSGCRVEGAYASTLHFFKALEDIIPLGNR